MESITAGVTALTTIVGDVFTIISGNPLLAALCAASLLGAGISVFSQIKAAAR